jgi:hypothetical protein
MLIWWVDEIYEDESEMCALALLLVLLGWGLASDLGSAVCGTCGGRFSFSRRGVGFVATDV